MVKNKKGGNKSKRQGSKFQHNANNKALRVSKDPSEMYAVVTKMCGGGMCIIMCIDEVERLCIIRK